MVIYIITCYTVKMKTSSCIYLCLRLTLKYILEAYIFFFLKRIFFLPSNGSDDKYYSIFTAKFLIDIS